MRFGNVLPYCCRRWALHNPALSGLFRAIPKRLGIFRNTSRRSLVTVKQQSSGVRIGFDIETPFESSRLELQRSVVGE